MFADRREAGRALAGRLARYKGARDALVLAVPRGGVPIGAALAEELGLPLDVVLAKKIGHPANPEFAIGAASLAGAAFDAGLAEQEGIRPGVIERMIERVREGLRQRDRLYRGGAAPPDVKGKTVILADDGAATGRTLLAAAELLRRDGAGRIVAAVPVAPPEALAALRRGADETVCLESPEGFSAIGEAYVDFSEVSDGEALRLLKQSSLGAGRG